MTLVGNGIDQKVIKSGIVLGYMSRLWEESTQTNSLIMRTVFISTSLGLALGLQWNGVEKRIQQLVDAASQILTGYAMGNWVTELVQDLVVFAEEYGINYFWDWAFHSSLCLEDDICEVNSEFLFMIQAAKISYCGHEPYLDDSSIDANSSTCHLAFNLFPFYVLFGAVGFLLIFVNFFGGGGDRGSGSQLQQDSPSNQPQNPPNQPQNSPNQPQNPPNQPQNPPNKPQNPPNQPQNPPNKPQNPPNQPQNPPNQPQNPQNQPQNPPNKPQNPPNQSQNPQNPPNQPQNLPLNSETTPESNSNSGDQPQSNNNNKQSRSQHSQPAPEDSTAQRIFAECPNCKREFTQQLSSPFPIICCNILEINGTLSISGPFSSGIHLLCSNHHTPSLEALLSIIYNKVASNLRGSGDNDLNCNINLRPEDVDPDMIKTILQDQLEEFLLSLIEHLCFRCQEKIVETGLVPNFCPICQTTHNEDEDCGM